MKKNFIFTIFSSFSLSSYRNKLKKVMKDLKKIVPVPLTSKIKQTYFIFYFRCADATELNTYIGGIQCKRFDRNKSF